jgi:hypothetical protein
VSEKGFAFSLEACITLILLAGLLLSFSPPQAGSLDSVLLMQKGHDLLKIWNYQFEHNRAGTFEKDFRQAFPGKQGRLEVFQEGLLLESIDFLESDSSFNGNQLVVEGLMFSDAFNARHFRLTIISP